MPINLSDENTYNPHVEVNSGTETTNLSIDSVLRESLHFGEITEMPLLDCQVGLKAINSMPRRQWLYTGITVMGNTTQAMSPPFVFRMHLEYGKKVSDDILSVRYLGNEAVGVDPDSFKKGIKTIASDIDKIKVALEKYEEGVENPLATYWMGRERALAGEYRQITGGTNPLTLAWEGETRAFQRDRRRRDNTHMVQGVMVNTKEWVETNMTPAKRESRFPMLSSLLGE